MQQLIVISAPSGAGKTSLVHAMVTRFEKLVASISYTTRAQRDGEIDSVDYHFVSREEFNAMVGRDEFLEYAEVFGNFYGTSYQQINATRDNGFDVILEIDWQGARNIKARFDHVLSIFVLPPSIDTLRERLIHRAKDDPTVIEKRMKAARDEMSHFHEYQYLLVNDDFGSACEQLAAIIEQRGKNEANLTAKIAANHPQLIASIASI